jgi:sulfate/thiosulfate transport system permease protein
MTARRLIRFGSLSYLTVILVAPVGLIFWRAFEHGRHPFWAAISNPDAVHALKLTL